MVVRDRDAFSLCAAQGREKPFGVKDRHGSRCDPNHAEKKMKGISQDSMRHGGIETLTLRPG